MRVPSPAASTTARQVRAVMDFVVILSPLLREFGRVLLGSWLTDSVAWDNLTPKRGAPTAGNGEGCRFRKSLLCNGCRSCVALRRGSQPFHYRLDPPAARVVKLQREGLAIVRNGTLILPDESERVGTA